MSANPEASSRREFVADVGRLASAVAVTACAPLAAHTAQPADVAPAGAPDEWDLGWMDRLARATDRAVFDWPTPGDPADPIVLQIAERYLNDCAAVYGSRAYEARVVLNIRTRAVAATLTDPLWARYALGTEYDVKDPATGQPATRNPFWHRAPSPAPGIVVPTLADLLQRDAIVLVCDFALGHLAGRLATKAGSRREDVHRELRAGLVPGAFAVPSGIFGLARAQNSGCAYVRM